MPNPSGNYSRIKTWGQSDTVLAADLNAEFDNVLSNFNPEMLASYSQNQAQMQVQTSPGSLGSESLATSLAGELERLRFQIAAITGNTYWYSAPAASLSQINSLIGAVAFGNKINSGLTTGTTGSVQPTFLLAANTTNSVTLKATSTPFNYGIQGTTYIIASDTTLTGLTQAPSSQNTATVNDLTLTQAGTASSQLIGENGTQITITSAGTNITSLIGNIAAFKASSGEYLIGRVESSTQITHVNRGYFFNSSNALISRGTLSSGDTLTLVKLAWIYATTNLGITVGYTNPRAGGLDPSSPSSGDYWFDTSVNYWKTYNGTSWVQANATLIGVAITDTTNTIATRSFDFFEAFSDTNSCELFADSQNAGTVVRSKLTGAQVNVYGNVVSSASDYFRWDFSLHLDTGSQAPSTMYYFYLDTNGRSWISKVAPYDRRSDLKGYYHPGLPWRCLGYGWSNAATLVDNVESFYRADDTSPVSNITAANNQIILPYNIIQREQVITLTGAAGAFTQVAPPPAQLKGKFLTYVRTDNNIANPVTIQSWGTAVANYTGTISVTSNPTVISGISSTGSLVVGQLITGPGIPPNTTVSNLASTSVTMSASAQLSLAGGTFNFANAAGYSGTVGQQTAYASYGINGYFSLPLYSQGETLTLTSDGYAYFIVQHYVPSLWITAGTLTIGATTTAPAKGTIVNDYIQWRRNGRTAEIRYVYAHSASGTNGSGDYLVSLPAGLTVDTTIISTYAGSVGTWPGSTSLSGASGLSSTGFFTPSGDALNAYLYSSTQFRLGFHNAATPALGVWGSGFGQMAAATIGLSCNLANVPIVGWWG